MPIDLGRPQEIWGPEWLAWDRGVRDTNGVRMTVGEARSRLRGRGGLEGGEASMVGLGSRIRAPTAPTKRGRGSKLEAMA